MFINHITNLLDVRIITVTCLVTACIDCALLHILCLLPREVGRGTGFIAQYTTTFKTEKITGLFLVTNFHVMIGSKKDVHSSFDIQKKIDYHIGRSEIVFRPSQTEITIKLADTVSNQGLLFSSKVTTKYYSYIYVCICISYVVMYACILNKHSLSVTIDGQKCVRR